jgi:N-acetylglucosaminyldiphosphoundecaprenol N-acetyl-beta-D-mannosaminyltransferase
MRTRPQAHRGKRPLPEGSSFTLLGIRINTSPFADVLETVACLPETGERASVHFATAHTLVEAQTNARLGTALATGLVEPDGMPLVWLGRMQGLPVERVCGPDFMPALLERGVGLERKHFFYGGEPGVPEALAARMEARFPGLRVVGTISPPFGSLSPDEDARTVERINAAEPDYVWVGLGTPKQDLWIADNRPRLSASALLAVGAAFNFHAGLRRRAPEWMQRTGTEWLFRLAAEPRRLARRYTATNARFVALVAEELLRKPRRRR